MPFIIPAEQLFISALVVIIGVGTEDGLVAALTFLSWFHFLSAYLNAVVLLKQDMIFVLSGLPASII